MTFQEFSALVSKICTEKSLTDYELYYMEDFSESVSAMEGRITEFSSDGSAGASLRCIVHGKTGYCSTELFTEESAKRLVETALENAQTLEKESPVGIYPGSAAYKEAEEETPDHETDMLSLALSAYEAVKGQDPRVQESSQAGVHRASTRVALMNSKGLRLEHALDTHILTLSAVIRSGEEQYNSHEMDDKPFREQDVPALSAKVVQKALDQIDGEGLPTGKYPVVFDAPAFSSLLAAFSSIFSAKQAQQGLSLLAGKEGTSIASPLLTITDDPFYPGLTMPFDAEGVATCTKQVVEQGVFKTLLYNLETAEKAGKTTTGNASRSAYYAPVDIAPFTFYVQKGSKTKEDLYDMACKDTTGPALLITSMAGLHAGLNPVTGDFSLMASGYKLEDGQKGRYVRGITVSGNFLEVLKNLIAIGDDLDFGFPRGFTRIGSPSIYAGSLSIAGK